MIAHIQVQVLIPVQIIIGVEYQVLKNDLYKYKEQQQQYGSTAVALFGWDKLHHNKKIKNKNESSS